MNYEQFITQPIPLWGDLEISFMTLIVILIVIIILKGVAMWRACKANSKGWFWALLILNTAGILPALYIFYFSKR